MGVAHRGILRASGGRVLASVAGMPVLLLTTTGRRSGRPRTTPLTYFKDGRDLVVVASFGGSDTPPGWLLNLRTDPRAVAMVAHTRLRVTARPASAVERDRLWPLVTETFAGYADYQRRTAREIPLVLLSPEAP